MSSEESISDESGVQIVSTANCPELPTRLQAEEHSMKRVAARRLIERYYVQLTDGCGRPDCDNEACASSGERFTFSDLSPDGAAVAAIDLLKRQARLCGASKVARSDATTTTTAAAATTGVAETGTSGDGQSTSQASPPACEVLTESSLTAVIASCRASSSWSPLIHLIGRVFSQPETLAASFPRASDPDRDVDVTQGAAEVDLRAVGRGYALLSTVIAAVPAAPLLPALHTALRSFARATELQLRYDSGGARVDHTAALLVAMELPELASAEFVRDGAMAALCRAVARLPVAGQARMARAWATHTPQRLRDLVICLQQVITDRVLALTWVIVNDDVTVTSAAVVLKLAYYASLLSGRSDPPATLAAERRHNARADDSLASLLSDTSGSKVKGSARTDPLEVALGVRPVDCRAPAVAWDDFVNEPLSFAIDMEKDYTYYRAGADAPGAAGTGDGGRFSFMNHPFLLTTAVKSLGMYYDNRVRMLHERRASIFHNLANGAPITLYLRLRIRRDHIVDDALVALEMVAMENPQDLKKQLYIEFEGEQGIDEGGVSKEFFQLVIEELFNPDIGMFTYCEDTRCFWPHGGSFETDGQFTLIGIVLGLAIYNHVILDVHLPATAYRKLLGKAAAFEDLVHTHPTLARSLRELLDYEGDVEETFMQSFLIGYQDVFGATVSHELRPDSADVPVTNANRQEFVELYADYLLNQSVERQFVALRRGFQMVTDESPLQSLFSPAEVELLICGSKNFDFMALEQAAEYDGGFVQSSPTVLNFWSVFHEFTEEQKRKVLQFTTGSDRVPVGGLSKLKLIISRNGPDSDRLPTAHTCFNVLLMPDYNSRDKLQERLLVAINYTKGFGML